MNESFPSFSIGGAPRAVRAGLAAAFVALALPGAVSLAHAEKADQNKPINVEADNLTYDDLKQVTVATGNVVITKGTILIKGDRVEVRQDPQGYQYATATMAPGSKKHASFRQKREGLDEYIDGDAERIDYDGKQDLTTLTRNATVRRLQGLTTVSDTVHGSVITYDGQRDFYTAKGGNDVAAPGNPTGRVRAMLSPKNGGPAPLNGASATLTPSNSIQEPNP
ncbi:lipopolysaccharide transport periplasmic protein LptA [Burkholderia gladioli]|uniref:Lipopolysaccharide export system protein LptA n=1 Tax=Burkholderia gladioli TaxID=28095 RepID=A0A2A7S103_BURGA|nr:lipopolysaccharide transport periplasmic protein LptA [Burkholderia gladioli]MBU9423099.1 lipopolysaccharide transport periplasmic protein LptA [Burkholderia gladioli]MDN7802184.1 lipopolysaccharide transport periplasmic protein LptA [Burkholderia gladioli]MDN8062138.1 lipopolysaccharide transport periplasmic protein LptA [Burkholderia gladioli]PEH36920.1 lipopolysaccharide transport periplasmic protein LptA [Burkholderia gladioli]QPQ83314.1 lipopolysaccharide transport periplasmic protein 